MAGFKHKKSISEKPATRLLCFGTIIIVLTVACVAFAEPASAPAKFSLPALTIDAEKALYQGLLSRPQDEISNELILERPTENPVDLLRSLNSSVTPGNSLLGAIFTPQLRGFESNQTKVLVDGCPVNTPWNGASSLSGFPLRRLQKITVAPGGSSLIYGPNGMAGAINLVLPTAKDLEGLTVTTETGNQGRLHQEYIYGKVSHNNEHLFGLFTDKYGGKIHYKNYGTGGSDWDNKMFMYRGRVQTDNGWIFKATILDSDGTLSIPNYKERFDPWRMSHRDFVIEKDFADDKNLILRHAEYKDFSSTQYYLDYELKTASGTIDPADDVTVRMRTSEILYNFPLGEKHHLTLGGQKQEIKDEGHSVKPGVNAKWLDTTGYFISDSIDAAEKLKVNLTARSDESFSSDTENSWSAAADYKLGGKSSIGAAMSRTLRFPNFQELYRSSKVFGNENLNPETADNKELRFSHQVSKRWSANVARFTSDIDDKITQIIAASNAVVPGVGEVKKGDSYYINIAEAKIEGWEAGINGTFNDHLDGWLSYTRFDKAEDTTHNLRLVSKPDYRMTGAVRMHDDRTSVLLNCEYQGKIPATKTLDSSGKPTIYEGVDSWVCLSLNIRRKLTEDCTVYLNIDNLTDKDDIVLTQASDSKNKAGLLMDPITYKEGRRSLFGIELKF